MILDDLCPCGHTADEHEEPDRIVLGEAMGACRKCPCSGLLDWTDDDDE